MMEFEEAKCGTFEDWSFGAQLKRARIEAGLSLRQYGLKVGLDNANVSHLEMNRHSPPNSLKKLLHLVNPLKLEKAEVRMMAIAAYNFHIGKLNAKWPAFTQKEIE